MEEFYFDVFSDRIDTSCALAGEPLTFSINFITDSGLAFPCPAKLASQTPIEITLNEL